MNSLVNYTSSIIPEQELMKLVFGFVTPLGEWDWVNFARVLLEKVCRRIVSIIPRSPYVEVDSIRWHHLKDGRFFVKSAYFALTNFQENRNGDDVVWKKI